MDLSKLPNDMKLQLCKTYFKVGCVFLPFVWAVNVIWFFRDAFTKPEFEEQKLIKKYVIMSGIGSLVWTVLLITWIIIYQANRVSWGVMGETISFLIPLGRA